MIGSHHVLLDLGEGFARYGDLADDRQADGIGLAYSCEMGDSFVGYIIGSHGLHYRGHL